MLHAAARRFTADEQAQAGALIARRGLAAGCVLYTTFDKLRSTVWGEDSVEARRTMADELRAAIDAARRIGSTRLAIVGGADETTPLPIQHAAFIRNLAHAADLAEEADMVLCLETIDRERVPGMLLHHLADALNVVRAVDRPSVRLLFDTAHVQAMDFEAAAQLELAWDAIEIVQIGGPLIAAGGGGTMTFVGSMAGDRAVKNQLAYGVAKAALHHLVRMAALELGPSGVRVNAVAPGFIRTPRLNARLDEAQWATIGRSVPLGRAATPAEIAAPLLFLSSGLSSHVSGQVLAVDGGTGVVGALPDLKFGPAPG